MDAADRAAIERLFARLADVADRAASRDPQADALIARHLRDQPGAAYFMAQTIIAQEQALKRAEAGFADVEDAPHSRADAPPRPGPWGDGAGGFLAGAAQTAVGVAGGLMLASAFSGLFDDDADDADGLDGAFGAADDAFSDDADL